MMRPSLKTLLCLVLILPSVSCSHLREGSPPPPVSAGHCPVLLKIYQGPLNHLAAVRRGACPMHPSCSEYSRQAITKHGARMGLIMTIDRLIRCGRDEMASATRVRVGGQWKFYDPVSHNDFWWQGHSSN